MQDLPCSPDNSRNILYRLRIRIGVELLVLATLTALYLKYFPYRQMWVDGGFAIIAVGLLAMNAKFTKKRIWVLFPAPTPESARFQKSMVMALMMTMGCVFACLIAGLLIGYMHGGWPSALARVKNWHIIPAAGIYFPWALAQQWLFQFYLFGRLLIFLPPRMAVIGSGMAFALVHLPEMDVVMVTAVTGILWSYMFYRYRRYIPLALSQACLGSAFFHWFRGEDLVRAWGVWQ